MWQRSVPVIGHSEEAAALNLAPTTNFFCHNLMPAPMLPQIRGGAANTGAKGPKQFTKTTSSMQDLLWASKKKRTIHRTIAPWTPFPGGKSWKHWPHTADAILNKRLVVLASPGSGKTFLIKSLLIGALKTHHPLIINVAPVPTLGAAQEAFLPDICYFSWEEFVTNDILTHLQFFQQHRIKYYNYLYKDENATKHWKELVAIIDTILPDEALHESRALTYKASRELEHYKSKSDAAVTQICAKYQAQIQKIYTRLIIMYRRQLMESERFNTIQRGAMSMVGIEPHLILIFDDLGESLKNWQPLANLWIRQRHFNIALVIIGHALRRQIPTTVRLNTSAWIIHGASIFKSLLDEHLVPNGPDKLIVLQRLALITNAPRKFLVFGELIEGDRIMVTESEYQSNEPAYPFLSADKIDQLSMLRDPLVNGGNYLHFFQRFWNLQFLHAHALLCDADS